MYNGKNCRVKEGTTQQTNLLDAQFIRTVLEQQRHAKELDEQEIQLTAENPRIREQNETTDISAELKSLRHDLFVQEKRRQQLRENNHELRQLEHQLHVAVTTKHLAEQLKFIESSKKEEEMSKRKENEEAEKERLRNLQLQQQEEEQERKKRSQIRANLLDQINGMKERRKEEYAEIMRDREEMQQMLQRFDKERENERKDLENRKKNTYEMMENFLRENEEHKRQMKLKDQTDDTTMMKLLEEREEERQRKFAERRKQWEDHAALSNRIGLGVFQTMKEKQKREDLLLDLLVEERNANEDLRFRSELEKREEQRVQMRSELDRYLGEMKYYKATIKKQEDESWNEMRKKIEEREEKEEQNKEEERRKRTLEYRKGILQLLEERRMMRAMSAKEERNLYEKLMKEQMDSNEEVQRERLRLLKSCSPDVLRYLPAGILKESDKEQLKLLNNIKQ